MDTQSFMKSLVSRGFQLFAGVPDSVLSPMSNWLESHKDVCKHIITANEGNAVGLAIGHYLGTGSPAVVYMQNSGLGNTVNPLTSLAASDVYKIPMLLVIGWRGMPGKKDEPQHAQMGRITPGLLDVLEIPYFVGTDDTDPDSIVTQACESLHQNLSPIALVMPKGALSKVPAQPSTELSSLKREEALRQILSLAGENDSFIATTGKTGRELFELRVQRSEAQNDFLTVGGMGHTSSIALGVALTHPERRIICLDGDGSLIMHMGSMGIIGKQKPKNLVHIILNNGCHESVGGQPTVAPFLDFGSISQACGYPQYRCVNDTESLKMTWNEVKALEGPVLLEIKLAKGSRSDLGRPTSTPQENKKSFMENLSHVASL